MGDPLNVLNAFDIDALVAKVSKHVEKEMASAEPSDLCANRLGLMTTASIFAMVTRSLAKHMNARLQELQHQVQVLQQLGDHNKSVIETLRRNEDKHWGNLDRLRDQVEGKR